MINHKEHKDKLLLCVLCGQIRNPSRWIGTIRNVAVRLLADAPPDFDCAFVPHADYSIIGSNFCQALVATALV